MGEISFHGTRGDSIGPPYQQRGNQGGSSQSGGHQEFTPTANPKQLRGFLGHVGFYRRFIKDFAKLAKPLTHLLCNNVDFSLREEAISSCQLIKEALVKAPIFQAPRWDLPFEIMCDASNNAVGAILGERINGNLVVTYYASKTLGGAQVNYSTTEKELLAIVFALEKLRSYVLGSKITVFLPC